MPYPNEHAARIADPNKFEDNSFRRKNITSGIDIIIGKLRGESSMSTQAYRFDKTKFTADEAKKWLKDHDIKYISFEPASEKTSNYEIERKEFKFEVKQLENIENDPDYIGSFVMLASTEDLDSGNDIVLKSAFDSILASGVLPKSLIQHDKNRCGAIYTKMYLNESGLVLEGKFINTREGRDLQVEVRTGAMSGASIGYIVKKCSYRQDEQTKETIRVIEDFEELPETSFVRWGMNKNAGILSAKSKPETIRDLETELKNLGYSQKEAKAICASGYKALNQDCDDLVSENQRDVEIKEVISICKEIKTIIKESK